MEVKAEGKERRGEDVIVQLYVKPGSLTVLNA